MSRFDALSREEKGLLLDTKCAVSESKGRLTHLCLLCGKPILNGFLYRKWNNKRYAHDDCIKFWANEARSNRIALRKNQQELQKRRASPMSIPDKLLSMLKEHGDSTWGDLTKAFGGARKKEAKQVLESLVDEGVLTTYLGKRNTVDVIFYRLPVIPTESFESVQEELDRLRREVRELRAFKSAILKAVDGANDSVQ